MSELPRILVVAELTNWLERPAFFPGNFGHFLHIAEALNLKTLGKAGAQNDDKKLPAEVQHSVRPFNPCMLSTVH